MLADTRDKYLQVTLVQQNPGCTANSGGVASVANMSGTYTPFGDYDNENHALRVARLLTALVTPPVPCVFPLLTGPSPLRLGPLRRLAHMAGMGKIGTVDSALGEVQPRVQPGSILVSHKGISVLLVPVPGWALRSQVGAGPSGRPHHFVPSCEFTWACTTDKLRVRAHLTIRGFPYWSPRPGNYDQLAGGNITFKWKEAREAPETWDISVRDLVSCSAEFPSDRNGWCEGKSHHDFLNSPPSALGAPVLGTLRADSAGSRGDGAPQLSAQLVGPHTAALVPHELWLPYTITSRAHTDGFLMAQLEKRDGADATADDQEEVEREIDAGGAKTCTANITDIECAKATRLINEAAACTAPYALPDILRQLVFVPPTVQWYTLRIDLTEIIRMMTRTKALYSEFYGSCPECPDLFRTVAEQLATLLAPATSCPPPPWFCEEADETEAARLWRKLGDVNYLHAMIYLANQSSMQIAQYTAKPPPRTLHMVVRRSRKGNHKNGNEGRSQLYTPESIYLLLPPGIALPLLGALARPQAQPHYDGYQASPTESFVATGHVQHTSRPLATVLGNTTDSKGDPFDARATTWRDGRPQVNSSRASQLDSSPSGKGRPQWLPVNRDKVAPLPLRRIVKCLIQIGPARCHHRKYSDLFYAIQELQDRVDNQHSYRAQHMHNKHRTHANKGTRDNLFPWPEADLRVSLSLETRPDLPIDDSCCGADRALIPTQTDHTAWRDGLATDINAAMDLLDGNDNDSLKFPNADIEVEMDHFSLSKVERLRETIAKANSAEMHRHRRTPPRSRSASRNTRGRWQ